MSDLKVNKNSLRFRLSKFRYYKKSGFSLSSGGFSNFYFDLKTAIGDSEILYEICREIENKIKIRKSVGAVGGIETGSIAIASAYNMYHNIIANDNISFFYVRKELRVYGTQKMIEGKMTQNSVLIEDVIFLGNNVKNALDTIRANKQNVLLIIPIIFRGGEEYKLKIQNKLKVSIDPIFYEGDFDERM